MDKLHVAVLMGGWSSEREVSLSSGSGIADALESLGLSHPNLERLPGEYRRPCARGQDPQLPHRELPPPQLGDEPIAHKPSAYDSYRITFAQIILQETYEALCAMSRTSHTTRIHPSSAQHGVNINDGLF